MGQAKLRGTLEQRQEQGRIKQQEKKQKRLAERQAYEDSLTPAQKKKRTEIGLVIASAIAIGNR